MSLSRPYAPPSQTCTLAKLAALPVLIVGVALWTPSPLRAQQAPPPQAPNPRAVKGQQKQLSLRNTGKDTITLELRVGDQPDCAANPPAATQRLPPGREWLIATPRPICWRRADAKASPGLASWHRHVLAVGEHLKLGI